MADRKPVDLAAVRALLAAHAEPRPETLGVRITAEAMNLLAAAPTISALCDELEAARAEAERLRAERPAAVFALRELLAVLHRDGGHYTEAVGLLQSATDAHAEIHRLRASPSREESCELVKRLRERCADLLSDYDTKTRQGADHPDIHAADAFLAKYGG